MPIFAEGVLGIMDLAITYHEMHIGNINIGNNIANMSAITTQI